MVTVNEVKEAESASAFGTHLSLQGPAPGVV